MLIFLDGVQWRQIFDIFKLKMLEYHVHGKRLKCLKTGELEFLFGDDLFNLLPGYVVINDKK